MAPAPMEISPLDKVGKGMIGMREADRGPWTGFCREDEDPLFFFWAGSASRTSQPNAI